MARLGGVTGHESGRESSGSTGHPNRFHFSQDDSAAAGQSITRSEDILSSSSSSSSSDPQELINRLQRLRETVSGDESHGDGLDGNGNGPPRNPPGGGAPSGAGGASFEMMVPGHKVGLIIGKGGETIKQLQEQSGAKIVIIQVRRIVEP